VQTLKAVYIRVHNPFNLNPTHFFLASATMALYCSSKFAIQVRELANIPNKGEIGRGGGGYVLLYLGVYHSKRLTPCIMYCEGVYHPNGVKKKDLDTCRSLIFVAGTENLQFQAISITTPRKVTGNSLGKGGTQKAKLNWHFQRDGMPPPQKKTLS